MLFTQELTVKQAFIIRSLFQLVAEYTYGNLGSLFPHATTTGIVEVSHKRKQGELEATEHIFLFIVREAIVFISSKIAFALFTCVQMHLAGVCKQSVSVHVPLVVCSTFHAEILL